jgi:hypothetical protein
VLKGASAFANTDGGFFIAGASREKKRTGPWRLDPVEFKDEPSAWLSRVIRNGLRPVPRFAVKEFEIDGKHLAIVNVDRVPDPPCVTRSGQVFTRVSGESPPVDDPTTLRRLHERGETRRAGAEAEALRAAQRLLDGSEGEPPYLRIAVALAPIGRADDISSQLFTDRFTKEVDAATDRLPDSPLFPYTDRPALRLTPRQDGYWMGDTHESNKQRWSMVASWDGSVGVALDVRPDKNDAPQLVATAIFQDAVRPAEGLAARLVACLGGYGPAHAVLQIHSRSFRIGHLSGVYGNIPGPNTLLPIRTWTPDHGHVTDEQFGRMRRELLRASGVNVYEPTDEEAPREGA